jgi:hypothetical protein
MYTPNREQLPIRSTPQPRPIKRHHTAREIAHRVHESLTTRVSKFICTIFLTFLLVVGMLTFILWLSLRPHRPRFHIHQFSISGLSQETGPENAQIQFNVTARNANQNIVVRYDSMNGSVYYRDQSIGWKPLLFPFDQEPKNTTIITDVFTLTNVNSQRWTDLNNDRVVGVVVFRLEISSIIRFKISKWESKHHRMHANCDVSVGSDGVILPISKEKRCPVYFT